MRIQLRPLLSLLLVAALGACERVTAPEAHAAAQTLERLGATTYWGSRGTSEYSEGLAAATGILRRLEGVASRIVVERDGRQETFNAVVFWYEVAGTFAAAEVAERRRTLVAWQSPGVRDVVILEASDESAPFLTPWVDDTTSQENFEIWRERLPNARQGQLFGDRTFWRASGVATVGQPGGVEARCAEGAREEDDLDRHSSVLASTEHGYVPNATLCEVVTVPVSFELAMHRYRTDVSADTLRYQQFDGRMIDARAMRLVALPQPVRGIRFRLRCDSETPEILRDRCPAGTLFAPDSRR